MKVETNVELKVVSGGKQIKINESTRKHTPTIYERLVEAIRACWQRQAEVEDGAKIISNILFQYPKKEGKEAIEMILEDDMEVFKDEKKAFRVYAQSILKEGRKDAKDRIKENNDVINGIIQRSERMAEVLAQPKSEHPMGTGMKRVKNEVKHRPRFMMEDLKFRFLRTIGVY